jgi:hypothetical protein
MYFFSPPGENERLIKQSGLKQIEARDTTDSAALLSKRWHDARERERLRWSRVKARQISPEYSGFWSASIP